MRCTRPLIIGRNGAVGSNHPLATQAGLDTLRAGGNAVDAAVAISVTLGVVEPMMSGLGGDGFYHVHLGGTDAVFNGTGPAAAAATADRFAAGIPLTGTLSASVPGSLAGIAAMHAACGRMPWAGLFAAAIAHAQDGFFATEHYRHFAADNRARLAGDPAAARTLLTEGEVPQFAGLVRQAALARTLEEIASDGAETFYRGALARRLARGLAAQGSLITEKDLAAVEAERVAPIAVRYRGLEVRQTPPNSTGFTFLQMLKIVERFDLSDAAPDALIHLLVEAKKRAFRDREAYGGDPRYVTIPLDRLLSDAHAAAAAAAIDPDRAAELPVADAATAGDTTYFCAVDGEGGAVSGIQSLNGLFGSATVAGDTGVLMNNRMAYWHLQPGHANRLAPGRRVRHTMNAPMVFGPDGNLWGVLGTPGADNQVQVNLQVLTAMVDRGVDPQSALEAPRWSSSQAGQGANYPHEGDGRLTIEPGLPAEVYAGLERRGHRLHRVGPLEGPCSMQVIRVMENGARVAASDPRRDGWAAAF